MGSFFFNVLIVVVGFLAGLLLLRGLKLLLKRWRQRRQHIAVIRIIGDILEDESRDHDCRPDETRPAAFTEAFVEAINTPGAARIVMEINSNGGSGVAAHEIAELIWRYRNKSIPNRKKIIAVVRGSACSAAYWIASACEEILISPLSEVGSIGVVSSRYGLTEPLKRLGVEVRLMTAGEHKAVGHPALEETSETRQYFQTMLNRCHQQFIAWVRKGRGERLSESTEIFTGKVWVGEDAINLGLADKLGSLATVQDELGGEDAIEIAYYDGYNQPSRLPIIPRSITIKHKLELPKLP